MSDINFDEVKVVEPHPVMAQNFPPVPPNVGAVIGGSGGSGINFPLLANLGGTGFSAFQIGDILYADTISTLAKLPASTNGFVLTLDSGLPKWAAIAAIGVIGGSGTAGKIPKFATAFTIGDSILTELGALITVTGNLAATGLTASNYVKTDASKVLVSVATIPSADISNTTFVTSVTGTANRVSSSGGLTPVIDIDAAYIGQNSITTLGTITTGIWQGTNLDAARIADGTVSNTAFQFINTLSSNAQTQLNAKQPIDSTLTALAAYNTNGILTQTAADTFVGRTITGTANRLSVTEGDGVLGNPTLDISGTYVGQASITTLGTIGTGVWQGTAVESGFGGTGFTTYAAGDLIYASAVNTLSKLAVSTNGFILTLVGGFPAWATPVATIGGSGTTGKLPKFATGTTLADSLISEAADLVTINSGNLSIVSASGAVLRLKSSGNVNQDFMVVDDSDGIRMFELSSDPAGNASLTIRNTAATIGCGFTGATNGSNYFMGNLGVGLIPNFKFDVLDNTASGRAGSFKQSSATGYGIVITPGADATYEALRIRNAADSLTRHSFFGSGDVLVSQGAGNFGIGVTSFGASMVGGLAMLNGTSPSGGVTDCFQMYSADIVAGNAAPHFRTELGDVIKLFKSDAYTPTNVSADRSYDANATTLDELADVVGTLIADLQLTGLIG